MRRTDVPEVINEYSKSLRTVPNSDTFVCTAFVQMAHSFSSSHLLQAGDEITGLYLLIEGRYYVTAATKFGLACAGIRAQEMRYYEN